jgi:hypothetical protein
MYDCLTKVSQSARSHAAGLATFGVNSSAALRKPSL